MLVKTAVANDIETAKDKARLDSACKKLLANKAILAHILKECLDEFKDESIEDIRDKYIEGTPEISEEAVHQDEFATEKIIGVDTADKSISEGVTTYDIKFKAIIPGTDMKVHMYINVEAQNDFSPGYPLIKRGLYYCCRMISSQYSREFTGSHYEKIKKVCSVWICTTPPNFRENSITTYTIQEKTITGNSTELKDNYDLLSCIMLCLGNPSDTEGVLQMLDVIITSDLNSEQKKEILERDFEIEMTREIQEEVDNVCNISDGIFNKGIRIGEERGEARGEARGRAEGRAEGKAEGRAETIVGNLKMLMLNMKLTPEQAMEALSIPPQEQGFYRELINS